VGRRSVKRRYERNLTHTQVLSISFEQTQLGHGELNWNRLLDKAIRVASKVLNDPKKVTTLLHINAVVGQKEDQGYRFLSDTGISVQGQDANGAWRAVYRIAKELSIPFDVEFMWLQKEGVAYAGQTGRFASN
jgi:hypothetical protein